MAVINTTSKNLKTYQTQMFRDVVNLVDMAINDLHIAAIVDAPKFVTMKKEFTDKGLTGSVAVDGEFEGTHLPAYIEFGTGLSAVEILRNYPQWIKDIAMQFYVNGRGTLQGKPYLYNNFLVIQKKFERDLKALVDKKSNLD